MPSSIETNSACDIIAVKNTVYTRLIARGFQQSLGGPCVSVQSGDAEPRIDQPLNAAAEQSLCRFFLLGPFSISDSNGTPLTPKAQKTCAMLAMLALSPRATRTRVWLRDKLWSDRGEEQGAASLRQALLDARRSFGDLSGQLIVADKKSVSLCLDKISIDTELLLTEAHQSAQDLERLRRSLNEDLLEGMDIRDPEFEDWLVLERQVWERRVSRHLEQPRSNSTSTSDTRLESSGANTEIGQKIMLSIVAVQLAKLSVSDFNNCVSFIRDMSPNYGGRVFVVDSQVLLEFERPYDAVRYAIALSIELNFQVVPSAKLGIGVNTGLVYRQQSRIYGTECDIALAASKAAIDAAKQYLPLKRQPVLVTEATAVLVQDNIDYTLAFKCDCNVENLTNKIKLFDVTLPSSEILEKQGSRKLTTLEPSSLDKREHDQDSRPLIAVLPFRLANASVDEYMSEGLADDVILALSNNQWLKVISRNSSFSYEYDQKNSESVAQGLGVDYILGGSIKVSGSVLTIIVTLESLASKRIVWSESFSEKLSEIMNLQERITSKISAHLLQELGKHEQVRAYESRIDDLTTWQLVHRGHWHMARRTSTGVKRAQKLYQNALQRDEYQSEALVALAWWHFWKAWSEHGLKSTKYDLDQSTQLCRKAMLMDRSDSRVHAYLGAIAIMTNQAKQAVGFFNEAIRLNPSLSFAYSSRGSANLLLGKPELAPVDIRNALALNPADYYRFHSLAELAAAYYFSGDYESAIEAAENSSFLAPRYWYARLIKIAALVSRNRPEDKVLAEKEKGEISARKVNVSEDNIRAIPFIKQEYNQRLIDVYKEV